MSTAAPPLTPAERDACSRATDYLWRCQLAPDERCRFACRRHMQEAAAEVVAHLDRIDARHDADGGGDGTVALTAFELLGENNGLARAVTVSWLRDTRSMMAEVELRKTRAGGDFSGIQMLQRLLLHEPLDGVEAEVAGSLRTFFAAIAGALGPAAYARLLPARRGQERSFRTLTGRVEIQEYQTGNFDKRAFADVAVALVGAMGLTLVCDEEPLPLQVPADR